MKIKIRDGFKQKAGIYIITNIINKKVYVGSSINVSVRVTAHKNKLKLGNHGNKYLQRAFDKYGFDNFTFNILEYCEENDLLTKEEYYIKLNSSNNKNFGYNICSFERGRQYHSKETKSKISLANKGKTRIMPHDFGLKLSLSLKGLKKSDEAKENIRKSKLGKKRNSFTKEWKENLGNSRRKFLVSILDNNGELIRNKITVEETSLFLSVSKRYITDALNKNWKCKGYILQKYNYKSLERM